MKYFGKVGYLITQDNGYGVFVEKPIEKEYYGDVETLTKRNQNSKSVIDDLAINNEISIVADAFAYENFHFIRYVYWMGTPWKVVSATLRDRPRITLSIGGVYNGPTERTTRQTS